MAERIRQSKEWTHPSNVKDGWVYVVYGRERKEEGGGEEEEEEDRDGGSQGAS